MSAPLYFLPGVTLAALAPGRETVDRGILARRGLDQTLSDCATLDDFACCDVVGRGPDGGPGLCLSALPVASRQPPRRVGFYAGEPAIAWQRTGPELWQAIDAEFPPRPADLERRERFAGHPVALGDGQTWIVPTIRSGIHDGRPELPRTMGWDLDGRFALRLERRFDPLYELAGRVAVLFFEPDDPCFGVINFDEAAAIAVSFLALNYRLDRALVSALALLNTRNWQDVLWAAIDGPKVDAYLASQEQAKKNAPPGDAHPPSGPGTPGAADSSPAIAPAAANSTS